MSDEKVLTKEIAEQLDNLASKLLADGDMPMARIKVVLDAMDVIKAQAKEIEELQAVIVEVREWASDLYNKVDWQAIAEEEEEEEGEE